MNDFEGIDFLVEQSSVEDVALATMSDARFEDFLKNHRCRRKVLHSALKEPAKASKKA